MNVNLSISATLLNSNNFFVVTAYSDPARTIVAETIIPSKPYSTPSFQVTFTTLGLKMYYFVLWENTTAVPGGQARNSVNFQPTGSITSLRADLYLTADISPNFPSGGSSYVDTGLLNWNYDLEMLGYGTLQINSDYTQDVNGGWTLLNGTTINPQQKFVLHFQPQVANAVQSQPSLINASILITTDTALDNTAKNKAILIQGLSASLIVSLPALSSLSNFDVLYFYSCGGNHVNVSIRANGSDIIQRNTQVLKVVLGQNETLKLFKITLSGVQMFVVDNSLQGLDTVGQYLESNYLSEINTVPLDGSLLSRAVYERLWDKVQQYSFGVLVSESDWFNQDVNNNFIGKGFFSTGNGNTNFRVPDLRVNPTRRVVDGSNRMTGSFQDWQMIDHQHEGTAGTLPTTLFGRGRNRVRGNYNNLGTGMTDLASQAVDSSGNLIARIGTQLITANTGIYLLCRI